MFMRSRDRGSRWSLLSQYETVGLQLNCREHCGSSAALSGVLKRVAEAEAREGITELCPYSVARYCGRSSETAKERRGINCLTPC